MFQAMLEFLDGTRRLIRANKHDRPMPLILLWHTMTAQGGPITRVFVHDQRKPPDGSDEYVSAYVESLPLTVEPEKES